MKKPVAALAVVVALAATGPAHAQSLGPSLALPPWSDAAGFVSPSQYQTIQAADLDGDGRAELLGRRHGGVEAWKFDASNGQWTWLPGRVPLWDQNNWTDVTYAFTIHPADVEGDGRSALMFRGAGGIGFWDYDAAGGDWAPAYGSAIPGTADDAQNGTWLRPSTYATLQVADMTADGGQEVVARMSDGVHVWSWTGSAWTQFDVLLLTDAVGWDQDRLWRTLRTGDFDGDGKAELMARGTDGVSIYKLNAAGHWSGSQGPALSDALGWNQPAAYATLRPADLDGDGRAEIYGLMPGTGVLVYKRGADGAWRQFGKPLGLTDPGWSNSEYYNTLHAADLLPGNPGQELMIRGAAGLSIYAQHADGNWTGEAGPVLSDAAGFDRPERYITIQAAQVDGQAGMEILARDAAGVRTWARDPGTGTWRSPSAAFPDYTSVLVPDELRAAYAAVPAVLGLRSCLAHESPSDNCVRDIRTDLYPQADASDLQSAHDKLNAATSPPFTTPPLDPHAWMTVQGQIVAELDAARQVTDHAANLSTFHTDTVLSKDMTLDVVKARMSELYEEADYTTFTAGLFSDLIEALAYVAPEELAVEVPLEEMSVLISMTTETVETFGGLDDPIEGLYPTLKAKLGDNLTRARDSATTNKNAALSDWGLLATWRDLVKTSGPYALSSTSTGWSTAVARSLRSYTTWLYKTLTPYAYFIRPTDPAYPSSLTFGENEAWSLYKRGGPRDPGDELDQLFQATSDSCRKTFVSDCGLGVPLSDLFLSRNGWNIPCYAKEYSSDSPCPTVRLSVTPSPHRNSAVRDLHGARLSAGAPRYIFLGPYRSAQRRVRGVRFVLDGRTLSRVRRHPFDAVGRAPARRACRTCARPPAYPLEPGLLSRGRHRLTAIVRRADGRTERTTARFRVRARTPHRLRFSERAGGRGRTLRGSTLSRRARLFFGPRRRRIAGVRAVRFRLDGRLVRVDRRGPYQLGRRLYPGRHRLVAEVLLRGGRVRLVRRASFTVAP